MGIGKQSKTLNKSQIQMIRTFLRNQRNGLRDETIFLLSVKSGLRSKEISLISWKMILKSDGTIDDYINLPNSSTKGNSGRIIPLHKDIKENLYGVDHKYDYLISISYNEKKTPNKGSAIFIHLTNNYKPTAGCVALKKKDFEILLKLINKKSKIRIG